MKPVRAIKLLGAAWRLKYVASLKGAWGECDDPTTKGRTIRISEECRGVKELEVLIHEMLHAISFVQFSEEFVAQASCDIARVLWRLGYRKCAEASS